MGPTKAVRSGRRIVTASFDDGHVLDLKVAEKLVARGMKATFYVAWNHPRGPEISPSDIRSLAAAGMEIGSHTWTHQLLTGRSREAVRDELVRSKEALEDVLGAPVTALSYPEGRFNAMIRAVAVECGFRLARTTVAWRTSGAGDPLAMPLSVMMLPLSRYEHVRHAVRDANAFGLVRWIVSTRAETDLFVASRLLFDRVIERGGVFHLYARSWQLDQLGLWETFDRTLDHVARWTDAAYVTNSGVA